MTLTYLIIALSLFLGVIFLLNINIPLHQFRKVEKEKIKLVKIKKLIDFQEKVKTMLSITGSKISVNQYFELSLVLFILGVAIGLFYNNLLISLVLCLGLPFTQFQMLLKKKNDMVRGHNEKLEIYMSMVTSAYMQSTDIEAAITESYNRMDQSSTEAQAAAKPFGSFIGQAAGNANLAECILDMKSDIDNKHFGQWCDKLAICIKDSSLRPVLPYVINRMRRKRTLDTETVTKCYKHYKDFITICIICLFFTLFIPLQQPSWRYIVTNTVLGKILTAIVLVVVLLAIAYVVKVNNPSGEKK